ncbi:unnamed protein product, partial [marine sediment metagenome]
MSEKKPEKHPTEIFIRSYPKVIFFWPLLITSFVLWLIQAFTDPNNVLGYVWFIVFFVNLFVTAFDFSSTKFFVLILAIVVVVLILVFMVLPRFSISLTGLEIDLALTWEFYMVMTIILLFVLGIVII